MDFVFREIGGDMEGFSVDYALALGRVMTVVIECYAGRAVSSDRMILHTALWQLYM